MVLVRPQTVLIGLSPKSTGLKTLGELGAIENGRCLVCLWAAGLWTRVSVKFKSY